MKHQSSNTLKAVCLLSTIPVSIAAAWVSPLYQAPKQSPFFVRNAGQCRRRSVVPEAVSIP